MDKKTSVVRKGVDDPLRMSRDSTVEKLQNLMPDFSEFTDGIVIGTAMVDLI